MSMNIPGLKIGHATDSEFHTGCTVFLCPPQTVASVDVRGPAPGSRESALLQMDKPIQHVNGIVLTGGSAFGLATADGVMRYLAEQGIGHQTPILPIPIVPTAVVYDLFFSMGKRLPDAEMGYAACLDAHEGNPAQGNVGAGAGVTVGKWAGFGNVIMKGGFGMASATLGDLVVSAAAVVNAVGDVVHANGEVLAGAQDENGRWLAAANPYRLFQGDIPTQIANTTLVVVATNAQLSKVEAHRLAQRAHDGMAIAIRPVHTTHDGDTAFALATGQVEASFNAVANVAVEMAAEAIRNSVRHAVSVGPVLGLASMGER